MMDVTRNVGNNHIDSDKHMDLKHWKRIISTVSSINTMNNPFRLSISISYYLAFVSVSYYGGSILGISHFLTYRNSSEIQSAFENKTKEL